MYCETEGSEADEAFSLSTKSSICSELAEAMQASIAPERNSPSEHAHGSTDAPRALAHLVGGGEALAADEREPKGGERATFDLRILVGDSG